MVTSAARRKSRNVRYAGRRAADSAAMRFLARAAAAGQGARLGPARPGATPLGPWLLLVVAIGLIMFGAYSCCEARWRHV